MTYEDWLKIGVVQDVYKFPPHEYFWIFSLATRRNLADQLKLRTFPLIEVLAQADYNLALEKRSNGKN